jgi:predicted regulator of Ras-like GTPase activity (Roadblock/LC7/MglB family)
MESSMLSNLDNESIDNRPHLSLFEDILARMNVAGQFSASVLASKEGLAIASAPDPAPYDPNTIAAMVTLVKGFVKDMQVQIGLGQVDEVSMVIDDRSRLICRYLAEDQSFVLAAIAPPGQSYRRITTKAVGEILTALKQYGITGI